MLEAGKVEKYERRVFYRLRDGGIPGSWNT